MAANTISILIQAQDKASAALRSVGAEMEATGNRASGFSQSLSRIRDVALGVYLPQLAAKFVELGRSAISGATDFEQSRVAFETMLGSAEKAQSLLTDISKFAKATPFELPEVINSTKQLLAFGVAQQDLLPTMRKLGDIASGVSVPVDRLTYVFGQVKVAGRLMGQDLLQFVNAGVPLLDYLSQTMGKTTTQIKKDMDAGVGPTFDDVSRAIDKMTEKGSKFGGMMDKQSHTFGGLMSNISDSFGQVLRAAVGMDTAGNIVKGSFFDRIKSAAEMAMPALQNFAEQVGPMMSKALDRIEDGARKVKESIAWINEHRDAILGTATAITAFFLPALIKAGVTSTVTTVKMVIEAVQVRTAWLVSATTTSAVWYLHMGRVVASGLMTASRMVIHAVAVSAAWVSQAAVASAAWLVQLPRIVAMGTVVAAKAAISALDTSTAWVINAIRVSFVWTTQELPKLVVAFAVTSAQATVHATIASARWVAAAAATSFAWVTQTLPRLIATFITTSAAATANALVASASWVASASTTATAWVVTELPRIIASFVAIAASSIANSAVAAAAWVAAAATSSATWGALSALIATPLVMPAIAIGAALAAIATVWNAYNDMMDAVKAAEASTKAAQASNNAAIDQMKSLAKNGTTDQRARAKSTLHKMGIAGYATGGFTGRGAANEIAGVVHKGEYVLPKEMVDQNTGTPRVGGGITVHIANVNNNADINRLARELSWRLSIA